MQLRVRDGIDDDDEDGDVSALGSNRPPLPLFECAELAELQGTYHFAWVLEWTRQLVSRIALCGTCTISVIARLSAALIGTQKKITPVSPEDCERAIGKL